MLRMMPENTSIDFLSKRKICAILSSIFLLVTVLLLGFKGLNWGIDFAGGTLVQIKTEKQVEIATLRKAILDVGIEGATLQEFEGSDGELLGKSGKSFKYCGWRGGSAPCGICWPTNW